MNLIDKQRVFIGAVEFNTFGVFLWVAQMIRSTLWLSDANRVYNLYVRHGVGLIRLSLGRGRLDGEDFASIAACAQLELLSLSMCTFTEESLAKLKAAKRLKSIRLHNIKTSVQLVTTR